MDTISNKQIKKQVIHKYTECVKTTLPKWYRTQSPKNKEADTYFDFVERKLSGAFKGAYKLDR